MFVLNVCFWFGNSLSELPKEHVSNYVFPMRCRGTSAASQTFGWSNSSARGFWRGVIGVLTYYGLMPSHQRGCIFLIQDRKGQPNMAPSNGHWLTKPWETAQQWCNDSHVHELSHFPRLSITICFGDVLGCYVNNAMWPCWLTSVMTSLVFHTLIHALWDAEADLAGDLIAALWDAYPHKARDAPILVAGKLQKTRRGKHELI